MELLRPPAANAIALTTNGGDSEASLGSRSSQSAPEIAVWYSSFHLFFCFVFFWALLFRNRSHVSTSTRGISCDSEEVLRASHTFCSLKISSPAKFIDQITAGIFRGKKSVK